MRQRDTILVDSSSRADLGDFRVGRNGRRDQSPPGRAIGGIYDLGLGFLGLAVVLMSDQNFTRLFPDRGLDAVNLGLVTLKPGADAELVKLRRCVEA